MTTDFQTSKQAIADRKWHVVDAAGLPLGRLASEVAHLLRGKHKPSFTPHVDSGDFVLVINASQIRLTGSKLSNKNYYHHSGYVGGLKKETAKSLLDRSPEKMITKAVWGMLPKGPLGRQIVKKLKVYSGAEHPHSAQNPVEYKVKYASAA
ncbi:MAG: 50S ribosomal protein L13 [Bdellovibrionota bacterium]